jgi:dGTPase
MSVCKHPIKDNNFYNSFDCEFLGVRKGDDYRTPFQRDRDRIIYSSALRRLQAKTQVFLSGEYDFYRTRLTHSIEVAQIGRSICNYLWRQDPLLSTKLYIDPDLVEAVCLAHDLGHPPFGHSGESTLNRLMLDFGGFEGNAQTLRMVTEIIYSTGSERNGMNPTRALTDGIMKYKTLLGQPERTDRYFLYDDQEHYLAFIFENRAIPPEITPGEKLNQFRSVECQIMDWADDTAYSLHDIIDGVHARFISPVHLEKWAKQHDPDNVELKWLEGIINAIMAGTVERTFSRKIGDFIAACRLDKYDNFMSDLTNRYHYWLMVDDEVRKEAGFYKKIASDIVFNSPQMQQLRYKWNYILERIFRALEKNYVEEKLKRHQLLPEATHQMALQIKDDKKRMRIICDHLAGMTDGFAIRTYRRLFDPRFGSIADLI